MPGVFNGVPGRWCGHMWKGMSTWTEHILQSLLTAEEFQFYRYCVFCKQPLSSALVQKAETAPDCEVMCPLRKRSGIFVLQQKSQSPPQLPSFGLPMSIHKYPWSSLKHPRPFLIVQVLAASRLDLCHSTFSSRKATSPPHLSIPTEDNDVAGSSSLQRRGRESGECSFKVWISLNTCFG